MIKRTCYSQKIIMIEKEIQVIQIYLGACGIGGGVGGIIFGSEIYKRERKVSSKLECIVNATIASFVGFTVGFAVVGTLP
jgi:D-serine dehydratase